MRARSPLASLLLAAAAVAFTRGPLSSADTAVDMTTDDAATSTDSIATSLLLVALSACQLDDKLFFSQNRLESFAASDARYSIFTRPYRFLNYKETCGLHWKTDVTRKALSTYGTGGGVVIIGRPGITVCNSISTSTIALRRPQPTACNEGNARGAAIAQIAEILNWRRVLLMSTSDFSYCASVLLELEQTLIKVGILVQIYLQRHSDEDILHPHVIIFCDTSIDVTTLQNKLNVKDILYLQLSHTTVNRTEIWKRNLKSSSTPKSVISNFLSDYFDDSSQKTHLIRPMDRHLNGRRRYSMKFANSLRQGRDTDTVQEEKPDFNSRNITIFASKKFNKRNVRYDEHLDYVNGPLSNINFGLSSRLLMLKGELNSPVKTTAESLYQELLDETVTYLESENLKYQRSLKTFHLYNKETLNNSVIWRRVVKIKVSSIRSLNSSDDWMIKVVMDSPGELELKFWRKEQIDEALEKFKELNKDTRSLENVILFTAFLIIGIPVVCGISYLHRSSRRQRPRRVRAVPVLSPADFQFPADERRRVGEGMETMLSWLQQFHEFGGSEPEQPDLLKRPEQIVHSAPSSTCSVTKLAPDNRIRYKGDPVHMKYLPASTLELRRKTTDVLVLMLSLRHENLNPFIGCLTNIRPALVFEACGRGSLEDVLMADDIRLDWTFRLSLLTDLVRGMRYLHSSPLRVHARLSSRNCVVDSRWVLRITDYGLPSFASAQSLPYPPRTARDLLWTAPEVLRETSCATVPGGTQAGDVYSFAIIMQEVIVRGEPYCMLSLTPEEILDKLRHPPPLIRPSVSIGAAPPEAVNVMRQCWSEQPDSRPDFNRLYDVFRHMHRGRKVNIVDSMFEMLEKYSNNLEELIKDRTEQLDMEKKKTEQLLNRMLPRSVAERLMMGLRVEPEEFEEVSIYFSDIVGFTALAARSSPVQVVDLLNDLYTTFDAAIEQYQVYKVETIGDAYMVVGGLPIRCNEHAENIATMALHLLHLAGRFRIRHLPGTPLHLRIGLHTGACCAGVVGLTMPRYCLFGDTVNTASRMESTGAAWRIQVSTTTAERLVAAGGYRLRSRGLTQIKGKGAMHTYWLLGKDGFDKPLPTPPPLESEEVLFEAEGENEMETSDLSLSFTNEKRPSIQSVERQRSDPSPTIDKFTWQRSGAVSAESSPPAPGLPRCRYLRSSMSTITGPLDTPRLSDRWATAGARTLRRQWSLERGDALAAAAAESPAAAHDEPLALRVAPARPPPPRYRTRQHTSVLDVSGR